MPVIETDNLTKDYAVGFWRPRPYRALDRLSLAVDAGEVFGFLGPNGAGKSTALKLLMGLIFPTSGTARIFGRPIGELSVRRRIGFLPENPYFYDYLTAEELLTYYAGLSGLRGSDRARRVAAVLDEVEIGAERRMRLRSYSKGMIQRVGVAQALVSEPELVFFDEPMSGLDPLGRRHLRQVMLRLRDRGCTVFFSSHILSDAEALCSRVAILAQGRLVAHGRLADIVAFELRGWELVVSEVSDTLRSQLAPRVVSMTPVGHQRYTLELAPDTSPAALIHELTAQGVGLVSVNPIRTTLEDYFVKYGPGSGPAGYERAGSMTAIRLIALAVFRESVRDRVPLTIVGFGILLVFASFVISQMTAGQDLKIIKDLGLAALSLLGLLIAVFIGIGLVAKEVEKRSIYSLLSKPVTREQLVVGKFAGLVMTLAVNLAAMTAAYYAVLFYYAVVSPPAQQAGWPAPATDVRLLIAVLLIFGELTLVTAVALFFSTFAGPLTATLMTLGLWVAGHFNADLRQFEEVVDSPVAVYLARAAYYLLPNLAPFNVKAEVVYGIPVSASHVGLTLAYAAVYVAVLLVAAMAVFRRRDFK